jgi:hypothetical protein
VLVLVPALRAWIRTSIFLAFSACRKPNDELAWTVKLNYLDKTDSQPALRGCLARLFLADFP